MAKVNPEIIITILGVCVVILLFVVFKLNKRPSKCDTCPGCPDKKCPDCPKPDCPKPSCPICPNTPCPVCPPSQPCTCKKPLKTDDWVTKNCSIVCPNQKDTDLHICPFDTCNLYICQSNTANGKEGLLNHYGTAIPADLPKNTYTVLSDYIVPQYDRSVLFTDNGNRYYFRQTASNPTEVKC